MASTKLHRLTDTNCHPTLQIALQHICLITKFSPKIDHFMQSIKSNCDILADDGEIGGIFVQSPVRTSKQPTAFVSF